MNTLTELCSSAAAQRIGWALVHFLWQGAAVALMLAVMLPLLRNRSARTRWTVSCAALALMAMLPVATALVVSVEAPPRAEPPPRAGAADPMLPPAVAAEPPTRLASPPVPAPAHAPEPSEAAPPLVRPGATVLDPQAADVSWPQQLQGAIQPGLPWAILIWLAGVITMSVWHLGGWLQVRRMRRLGTRPAGPAMLEMFGRVLRRLGVHRPVRLMESVRVAVPVVVGWLGSVILMPVGAVTGLTPRQLEAVLAHELAHVRRWDCLVQALAAVMETLLFYHPGVWWVSRQIRREGEQCCDDLAVGICGDRRGYAHALAQVAELGRTRKPAFAAAATGGKLLPRIRRLLGADRPATLSFGRCFSGVLALMTIAAIAVGVACLPEHSLAKDTPHTVAAVPRPRDRDPSPQATQPAADQMAPTAATLGKWLAGKEVVEVCFAGAQMEPLKLRNSLKIKVAETDWGFRLTPGEGGGANRSFIEVCMRVSPENTRRLLSLQEELAPRGYHLDPETARVWSLDGDPKARARARDMVPAVLAAAANGIRTALPKAQTNPERPRGTMYLAGIRYEVPGTSTTGMIRISEITATKAWQLAVIPDQVIHLPRLGLMIAAYYRPGRDATKGASAERAAIRKAVHEAVAPLLKLEGDTARLNERPLRPAARPDPAPATQPAGIEGNPRVRRDGNVITLAQDAVDADLAALRDVKGIAELRMGGGPVGAAGPYITDAGLANLSGWTDLRVLYLPGLPVHDRLRYPNATHFTDAGLAHLRGLTKLQKLVLIDQEITDEGLTHLSGLTELRELWLDFIPLSDAGLKHLPDLRKLQVLRFYGAGITDKGLGYLGGMNDMRDLQLGRARVTDKGLTAVIGRMHKLETLDLQGNPISDDGLAALANLTNLQWLALHNTRITDVGLKQVAKLPKLQYLFLDGTGITDAGLAQLAGLKQLKRMKIEKTSVTAEGIRKLKLSLPGLETDVGIPNTAPPATQPGDGTGSGTGSPGAPPAEEVARYHRGLTGEDLSHDALRKLYTDQAMQAAQTGGDPRELEAAVRRAMAFPQDEATLVQLYIYLGDAHWRQTRKYTPEVWGPQRLKAAQAYLDGLAIVLQHQLPAEPPELPAVGRYDVEGPPEVVDQYRRQHEQEMAARKEAERLGRLVGFRQALTGQIVQMYARPPDDFEQLHRLALNHFGSQEIAAALVAGAKAYRANPHAPPVVLALPAAWGRAVDGLQSGLRFGLQNRAYRAGEQVDFLLLVRNTSARPVTLVDYVPLTGHAPTVRTVDGNPLPVAVPPIDAPVRMRTTVLKPGDTLEVGTVFLQLDSHAEATGQTPHVHLAPGKYLVSQVYRFANTPQPTWSGELTTGEVVLSVAAPEKAPGLKAPATQPTPGADKPAESEVRERLLAGGRPARATDAGARERFLAVERVARLPAGQQAKELSRLYRELAPPCMNPMIEGMLSSIPTNILDRGAANGFQGDAVKWAGQLADAAAKLTPEQVADKLQDRMWLGIAAKARAMQVFRTHAKAVEVLIREDLASGRKASVQRAANTILSLKLRTFTRELLALFEAEDQAFGPAGMTLLFLRDPAILQPLLARVAKDPKFLARCAGHFQGVLWRKAAEPLLLKLLDAPDAETRYHAARAVYECRDPKLAAPAVKFARDKEARFRVVAAYLASNLPAEQFAAVRKDLMPLLHDADEGVRSEALRCFAQQKDLAAGSAILDALKIAHAGPAAQREVTVMQALAALAGQQFGYDMHNWGPATPGNARAIAQFEDWMRAQGVPVPRSFVPGAGGPPAAQSTTQAAAPAEIERLVKQLGSGQFAQRDEAQKALVRIGLSAVAAIQAAAADKDPERADRAKAAVRQIEEASWGPPNEGLQVRLLPLRSVWKAGQSPELTLDIRNGGRRGIEYSNAPMLYCQVQLDGLWYSWAKPIVLGLPTGMLAPGKQYMLKLQLTDAWATPPGAAAGLPGEGSKAIQLPPGTHLVRVSFTGYPELGKRTDGIRCVSSPVQVEITGRR